ncbi:hypothetical protein BpHYR1_034969 [Brachionus plicatilis]|uniref:Uncharacterized protein n=1 Tax=Brachionus plicatilis TaxID=10195 RepID=A0A3M7S3V2_BRAPC|nr:hypothetical protein BpHYR1_034969 [Brachionus plicatilis]
MTFNLRNSACRNLSGLMKQGINVVVRHAKTTAFCRADIFKCFAFAKLKINLFPCWKYSNTCKAFINLFKIISSEK